MKGNKNKILKIILSKNPNCSGLAITFFYSFYFFIVGILSPVIVSLFEFFAERLSFEEKEKTKKYLAKLSLLTIFIYLCIFCGMVVLFLLSKFGISNFTLKILAAVGFLSLLILSFALPIVISGYLFLSRKTTKKPLLTFIFETSFIYLGIFFLIFIQLFLFLR